MSEPEMSGDTPDDPVVRAGEYALGVLEGEERAAAQRDMLAGGEFARAVEWWRARFAQLSEQLGPVAPSAGVWPAISARIGSAGAGQGPTPIAPTTPQTGLAGWQLAGVLAGTAAAAAAIALWIATPGVVPTPAGPVGAEPQLIVEASGEDNRRLVTRIDPATHTLTLRVAGLTPDDTASQSPELWVVPEGGAPVSLGLIPGEGDFARQLTATEKSLLVEGATLAITIEERASAPHPAPTTPILVAAPLTKL
ncbi:MAG: anti-sigma factor [Novosphingobium sp.]|nr:anti-sigma factor [Novosphingobium sp.]